jgi:ribonuclease HIII|tara:strand:+ start:1166 stop:1351 length:186 start_codon:yes stop_codon:yes gene_type:complete
VVLWWRIGKLYILLASLMFMKTVTISKEEYNNLKRQANVDLLKQFMESFKDIKEGRVRRVK